MNFKILIVFLACSLFFHCPSARQACCNSSSSSSSSGGCTYQGWMVLYFNELIAEKEGKIATPNFYLLLTLEAYNNNQKCEGKTDDFLIDPFN